MRRGLGEVYMTAFELLIPFQRSSSACRSSEEIIDPTGLYSDFPEMRMLYHHCMTFAKGSR